MENVSPPPAHVTYALPWITFDSGSRKHSMGSLPSSPASRRPWKALWDLGNSHRDEVRPSAPSPCWVYHRCHTLMSPFSTMVSKEPQLSQGRTKEELFSTPVWSCSHPRNLKTELRNRDETQKKYETQAASNRKAACGVVLPWQGALEQSRACGLTQAARRCGASGFFMKQMRFHGHPSTRLTFPLPTEEM